MRNVTYPQPRIHLVLVGVEYPHNFLGKFSTMWDVPFFEMVTGVQKQVAEFRTLDDVERLEGHPSIQLERRRSKGSMTYLIIHYHPTHQSLHEPFWRKIYPFSFLSTIEQCLVRFETKDFAGLLILFGVLGCIVAPECRATSFVIRVRCPDARFPVKVKSASTPATSALYLQAKLAPKVL